MPKRRLIKNGGEKILQKKNVSDMSGSDNFLDLNSE